LSGLSARIDWLNYEILQLWAINFAASSSSAADHGKKKILLKFACWKDLWGLSRGVNEKETFATIC
jgi:hypothetical protein